MLTWCSTIFRMFCSTSRSVEVLAVAVPPALFPGWADMRAMCDEVAVELPAALVPGWADKTAVVGWADVISTRKPGTGPFWKPLLPGQWPGSPASV